jgi:hypothetical protein
MKNIFLAFVTAPLLSFLFVASTMAQPSIRGACIQSGIPVKDNLNRHWSYCWGNPATTAFATLEDLLGCRFPGFHRGCYQSPKGYSVSGADITCWRHEWGDACVVGHIPHGGLHYVRLLSACIQSGIPARTQGGDYWSYCFGYSAQAIYATLVNGLNVRPQTSLRGESVAFADMACWRDVWGYACVVPGH